MITYGIIPNGFGPEIIFNDRKRIFFQPSTFYEGIFLGMPPEEKKEIFERNNYDYSELEKEVMKVKGSKKLTNRRGIQKGDVGGTVGIVIVNSRRHGGRSDENKNRIASYTVMVKGAQLLDGKLQDTFDISCNCKDSLYKGLGEFTNRKVCCAHAAAALYALYSGHESLKECKPMLKGEIFLPFVVDEDLAAYVVKSRYIDGRKLFNIDKELMRRDILSPHLEDLVDDGRVIFTCSKKKEEYPDGLGIKMWKIRKNLLEMGYKREGIAKEFDGNCYWNYSIDKDTDLRIMPNIDEGTVSVMKVTYVDGMSRDEIIRKFGRNVGYGRDPLRRRMRVYKTFELKYPDKSELRWIIGR
ncbi:MAG: SWIM zinc finger family protein [Nanoarchaeota archaeon]|nr:SWIM zinc finger family protein [Nanoarchaeota archaeon]